MWPILLAAGASIAGGLISANTTRNNGQIAQQTANANAALQQQAGQRNAQMITQFGAFNAGLAMQAGQYNAALTMREGRINADLIKRVATFNATAQSQISEYNASLLEQEVDYVWEAADLDITQLEQRRAVTVGTAEANFAASGVVMGQDSPADVVADLNTQFEMDKLIIRHGADREATRYLDAAAKSRWEGTVTAQQILYEAELGAYGSVTNANLRAAGISMNAGLQAAGIMGQAAIDSRTVLTNAQNQAYSTRYAGWSANQVAQNTAGQQVIAGFLGGITAGSSVYAMKALPTSGGTTLTPRTSTPQVTSYASPTSPGGQYGSLMVG